MPQSARRPKQPPTSNSDVEAFELEEFFPYQARRFYSQVKDAVSQCYVREYGMTPPEWRTMANLGPDHQLTAAQIANQSLMDKVAVSRAVAKLSKRGFLETREHAADGRSKLLQLSPRGRQAYHSLIPKVLDAEKALLKGLSRRQIEELKSLMAIVCENVQ